MNDLQTASKRLIFLLYANDMTSTSTLYTFTQGVNHDVIHRSYLINLEQFSLIGLLLANIDKTKLMISHNHKDLYRYIIYQV